MQNGNDLIEQAILYVKENRTPENGTILAKTSGIHHGDEEELLGWAFDFEGDIPNCHPPKQSEISIYSEEPHLYFHPLPSGAFALGFLSSQQISNQNETSLYSHCLVISPELLRAFDNNAVAFYHSLVTRKDFHFFIPPNDSVPKHISLKPIKTESISSPIINRDLLDVLRDYPGTATLTGLLASSLYSVCTLFTWVTPSIPLINGLIQCLPPALRTEMSFATSLHFSALRPLRMMGVREYNSATRQICQKYLLPLFNVPNVDQNTLRNQILSQPSWAGLIYRIIDLNQYDFFEDQMKKQLNSHHFETQQGNPDWHLLNRFGEKLIAELEREMIIAHSDMMDSGGQIGEASLSGKSAGSDILRGDFAHQWTQKQKEISPFSSEDKDIFEDIELQIQQPRSGNMIQKIKKPTPDSSAQQRLARRFPRFENELRQLDSLIARSLFGDQTAMEMLDKNWRKLRESLNYEEISIIRESYIQLVQSIIVLPRDPKYPKHPRRTLDALDVMNVFLQE